MKILGIVTEYNPFHNGHKLHIEKAKRKTASDYTIAVISGNYVQRGEPAILDKYMRCRTALENGVDIVVELPLPFATASAEKFAYGAVCLLDALQIVDTLCFGTEEGDLHRLQSIAAYLSNEPPDYQQTLRSELAKGVSYPTARTNALSLVLQENMDLIQRPNNILALEYMKALNKIHSKIIPTSIQRETAGYHSLEIFEHLASATAIRHCIVQNRIHEIQHVVPNFEDLQQAVSENYHVLDQYSSLFHAILLQKGKEGIKQISGIEEGLENRIFDHSNQHFLLSDLLQSIKTKRFTATKLQRAILHILLNIEKNFCETPPYIRILGFRRDAVHLLHDIKKKASLPVFTNLKDAFKILDEDALKVLQKEMFATDLYELVSQSIATKQVEFQKPVVIL